MAPIAPPIEGHTWLTDEPLSWPELGDKTVVGLFWSFGCEASLFALRQLADRLASFGDDVVTIAIHTPRFAYEHDLTQARAAVDRHRITIPVIHDADGLNWRRYSPGGWPACVVIDRRGRVLGLQAGTTGLELIEEAVAMSIGGPPPPPGAGLNRPTPRRRADDSTSSVWFPTAVATTPSGQLVIGDTGNDRILLGELDADLRTFRPSAEITDIDQPVAVAAAGDGLIYVAEGETGDILRVDLDAGRLDLVTDALTAPRALLIDVDGSLVVADAGVDQLFRIRGSAIEADLDDVHDGAGIGIIAGCGLNGRRDGSAGRAELAQPVGLTRTQAGLVFVDAATSNIRLLTDGGRVMTVTDNGYYDWGLVDGPAHRARLQRPTGVAGLDDGSVAITDTGNHRIRLLEDRRITTLGLSGLDQPTGITALKSGHLVVADTGNHRVIVVDRQRHTAWPLAVYPAATTSIWEAEPATIDET